MNPTPRSRQVARTRALAGALAVAVTLLLALITGGLPAGATDITGDTACTTVTHTTVDPFVNLAADGNTHTNGTHTLTADGVKIVTPDDAAKVYGYLPLSPAVPVGDIHGAGFGNVNTAGLTPSYQFGLYFGDTWAGTLAWEAVYQDAGKTGTADVLHHGTSRWYVTKSFTGYPAHTVKTWNELAGLLPKNAVVKYFGLNQGAGGIATNTVNNLVLWTKTCVRHVWKLPPASPSASPSPSGSASPSPSASASAPVSHPASPSASTVPIVGQPSLPVTGSRTLLIAGIGALLVAVGAAGIIVSRRRRDPVFTAE